MRTSVSYLSFFSNPCCFTLTEYTIDTTIYAMKTHTFKHGIHPGDHKEMSENSPLVRAFPFTKTVCIPVTQGGAPNQVTVAVGDKVVRGQKIAEADSVMAVPVHASVCGTVEKIESCLVSGNTNAMCVIIAADGSDKTDFMPPLDPFTCSKDQALDRIRQAGIVGMGGAAFPTHVKLNPPQDKPVEYALVNACECEPYLTVDAQTIASSADKIIDGLSAVMHIIGAQKRIIALEDNKKAFIPALKTAIQKSGYASNITIGLCKTKYPQGGEKAVIKALLNREIPSGGLPCDVGCCVVNVGTVAAVSEAFREGKPLIERSLTVSGGACVQPKNLTVPIGTLVSDLVPHEIELKDGMTKKIVVGGPMMGFSMPNADFPVQKNTNGVLFLTDKETSNTPESPCINCGRCIQVCPCGLYPVMMVKSVKGNDLKAAVRFGLDDCIECGACAWICPAKVRLVEKFRTGKQKLRAERQKQARLAAARGGK